MKERDFYEWCFREQGRGDQEKEKQLNGLERLRVEVAQVPRADVAFATPGRGERYPDVNVFRLRLCRHAEEKSGEYFRTAV